MEVIEIDDAEEASPEDERGTAREVEHPEPEPGGLGGFVSEHPLATLGGALAVGYILGGGLLTPLTRRLFKLGVRLGFQLALVPALEKDVAGLASTLGQTLRDASQASRSASDGQID